MFRQTGYEVIDPLTREYAREFSALPKFKGDRVQDSPQGRRRMRWLQGLVEIGEFYSPTWAMAQYDDTTYKMDGGHSSLMLADYPQDFPEGLAAFVMEFECETRIDLASLFDHFNCRESIRTPIDKVKAHKGAEDSLDSISPTDVGRLLSGIAYFWSGCGSEPSLSENERIALMHKYTEYLIWARPFARKRYLGRAGVLAAVHATYSINQKVASEFWEFTANESHPNHKHPSRVLAKFLTEAVVGPRNGQGKWEPRAFYVKSIHAWNAFRDGTSTILKYHRNAPLPVPH